MNASQRPKSQRKQMESGWVSVPALRSGVEITNLPESITRRSFRKMIRLLFVLSIFPIFDPSTASVSLVWDGASDKTIANYRVYYADLTGKKASRAKSLDVGNVTHATISKLTPGHTYYFVVTAVNGRGRESAPSNIVKCVAGSNQLAGSSRARPNDQKKASPHR